MRGAQAARGRSLAGHTISVGNVSHFTFSFFLFTVLVFSHRSLWHPRPRRHEPERAVGANRDDGGDEAEAAKEDGEQLQLQHQ